MDKEEQEEEENENDTEWIVYIDHQEKMIFHIVNKIERKKMYAI